MNKHTVQKGFTLIEVLVALFVFSVGLIAIAQLYTKIITQGIENRDLFSATALAQEGTELLMILRNSNLVIDAEEGAFTPVSLGGFFPVVASSVECTGSVSGIDCSPSGADAFRIMRGSTPEYFQHGLSSVQFPVFWRHIYLMRHTQGTPSNLRDDEIEVKVLVSWSNAYVFPSMSAVVGNSYSCARRDSCVEVSTTLNQ